MAVFYAYGNWDPTAGYPVSYTHLGIGTLTFVDNETGVFAGLGHSIHDVDTGTTISLLKGEIVPVSITGVTKGSAGSPGELKGSFSSAIPTGTITVNGETGVYGKATAYLKGTDTELALAQEIKTGPAEIITTLDGQTPQHFSVQIEKVALSSDDPNRNMILHVTDQTFLNRTGGIVPVSYTHLDVYKRQQWTRL